jgi:undecaprenyl diphosphate synthase
MHVAIIMDGNGRWATQRGKPRSFGHRAGAKSVDAVVETAARMGIATLTLYAFSAANWQRPSAEVNALMSLFRRYLGTRTRQCLSESIRINVIGRRDRLQPELLEAVEHAEWATASCSRMDLRIAIDYSSQRSLAEAGRHHAGHDRSGLQSFAQSLAAIDHSPKGAPEVDLLIRTGGEQRLSDFMLWESAYAELYFTECPWPDFGRVQFEHALAEFARRRRTFGNVPDELECASHG